MSLGQPDREVDLDSLAVRAKQGDSASFDELVTRLRGPLVAFLSRRLADQADADDVAQETFLRAYRHIDSYDPERRFTTWLFAIGKNVAASHRAADRRRGEVVRASGEEAAVLEADPAAAAEGGETWSRARRLLSDDQYRALWLRYARDLSIREIARELGRSSVATKVMLFRARKKLLDSQEAS
ncbi:MAG TPA: RNA polymerase sigma factor [Kofleriaceae bacterium]|nr:RNA polymerase sigma factor [Kofleriaceae bacterium]